MGIGGLLEGWFLKVVSGGVGGVSVVTGNNGELISVLK